MSNNKIVIETLTTKREQLLADQKRIHYEYQQQIDEIEDALDQLAGKSVWRAEKTELYDDVSSTYITGSEDGI